MTWHGVVAALKIMAMKSVENNNGMAAKANSVKE
jgi:hypothetical protein